MNKLSLACFLLFSIVVAQGIDTSAQNKPEILELDEKDFEKAINKSSDFQKKEDWQVLKTKTEDAIKSNLLIQAISYSQKSLILAEKLQDVLLKAKSLGLLAFCYKSLEDSESAISLYEDSLRTIATLEDSEEKTIETGYLINGLASLYIDPYFGNTQNELVEGLRMLQTPFEVTNINSSAKFNNLKYLTHLKIGKALGVSGNFVAQIIWLEKLAAMNSLNQKETLDLPELFELHFELQRAYRRIADYKKSFASINLLNEISKKQNHSANQVKYLRELADFYGDISARQKIPQIIDQAIEKADKVTFQIGNLYTFKVTKLLQQRSLKAAKTALEEIERLEQKGIKFNQMDLAIIKAVIFCFEGDTAQSEKQFLQAEMNFYLQNSTWRSKLFILYWKSVAALFQKDFQRLRNISNEYLSVALQHNSKDSLPFIYLNLAKAEIGLNNLEQAKKVINQATFFIDDKRNVSSAGISIGVAELLFEAYQLETDLSLAENKIAEAFLSSENTKGRWLSDKIEGNLRNQKVIIDPNLKSEIFELTLQILKNPKDEKLFSDLSDLEKKAIFYENNLQNNQLSKFGDKLLFDLEKSPIDNQTAVVSYSFTNDGKLIAFVWQRGKELAATQLPISKDEVDSLAKGIQEKIRNLIFFKNEGQEIYDKLLKPLNLQAKHLIIIPDKSLWKIPFQALSEDGKTYLIENKTVSYAPSVSILLNQIKNPIPKRQTFQVFSNSRFNTIFLKYVDAEATNLAKLYEVQPHLSSTKSQFAELSENSDILHFSMHAEVDNDEAFNSFIGFKPMGNDDGRLTVDDLLKIKLRKGSLVFLASCDTNKVFNGEGLVSLAWGMMGAGATTVISTQWEANDKSTAVFTNSFYKNYQQGISSAEAMQKAALELIKNKSGNMHEPYFWADFSLNGDFR